MDRSVVERALKWTPRMLGVATAGFLALFSLDVFDEGYSPARTAVALVFHLIPSALVLAAVGLGWCREWLGAAAFLGLAALHVAGSRGRMATTSYLVVDGPLVLVAMLFLAGAIVRRRRTSSAAT